jgi:hypothetical protein
MNAGGSGHSLDDESPRPHTTARRRSLLPSRLPVPTCAQAENFREALDCGRNVVERISKGIRRRRGTTREFVPLIRIRVKAVK